MQSKILNKQHLSFLFGLKDAAYTSLSTKGRPLLDTQNQFGKRCDTYTQIVRLLDVYIYYLM